MGGATTSRAIPGDELRVAPVPGATLVVIGRDLAGSVSGVGKRFVEKLVSHSPELALRLDGTKALKKIDYSDRYLVTPALMRIFLSSAAALRDASGAGRIPVCVDTSRPQDQRGLARHAREVGDNWPEDVDVAAVFQRAASKVNLGGTLELRDRRNMDHARILALEWSDGVKWEVHLDEGFGFLRTDRRAPLHPFERSPAEQAERLMSGDFSVILAGAHGPFANLTQRRTRMYLVPPELLP
jgi:DEAD/DEAH box helicase domain-containing protein